MTDPTVLRERASALSPRGELFIGGRFVPAVSGQTFVTSDPATGRTLADVSRGTAPDVDLAVRAAREAFESGAWSRQAPSARKAVLLRVAAALDERREEFALLESLDGGKLYSDTSAWDIPGAAAILRWYAEAADKVYGEVAPIDPARLAVITREPLGVIAAVVPWNYPLEMAMWKIAPALVTGNSVILKPAEETPLTALAFAELCAEHGLPDGVFNVVTGFGEEAGQALGLHPDVDAIAFTGSTEVGKRFMEYSGRSNLKQVWPECGGKSANLVFADVRDLDMVAERSAAGIFSTSGQVCSANSRLLVHRSIAEELVERIRGRAEALVVGDPLDPRTQMGPLVSTRHAERVRAAIRSGLGDGRLVTGGFGEVAGTSSAAYVAPTVFADVSTEGALFRDEVFGPVLAVTPFDDEADAIRLANTSRYGLAASVFTDDLRTAQRVSLRLVAGTVTVNGVDAVDVTVPFGGFKQSGFGRDLSLHALDKYTGLKTRWFEA
jgi:gamma-glutamyl-gamma-aminobutyraldehyde dehydrogenase